MDKDKLKDAQKKRARKYGISPKSDGHLTPPKDYPNDPEQYADPVNYKYPIDEEHIRPAIAYFNKPENRKGYTASEWAIMGRRIAVAATRLLGDRYVYKAGKVIRDETDKEAGVDDVDDIMSAFAVKELDDGRRVGAYAVVWGSPDQKDISGEYFTPETEEMLSLFKSLGKLPLLYRHAGNDSVKTSVVGIVDHMEMDDIGVWYEAELNDAIKYKKAIVALARAGMLGTSTGTFPRARRVDKDGRVKRWPIAEVSFTPIPAEPRLRYEHPVSVIKEFYSAIGIDLPEGAEEVPADEDTGTNAMDIEKEYLYLKKLIMEANR